MTFDTLDFVKHLTKAGVDRKQAEAHAKALKEIAMDGQATKDDLERLADKLTIRFGIMLVAAIGAITTLDQLLK